MSFLQPSFLGFFALAAIPVVLYLLFRRRRREVDWGAIYILRRTLASERRENLWKQIAIIALRTLLLAALVLAFARPLFPWHPHPGELRMPHPPGTVHRVVLLDNSLSMAARHGSISRLDLARDTAVALLASLRPGDSGHLIALASDATPPEPAALRVPPGQDERTVRDLVTAVPTALSPIRFTGALRAALDAFRGAAAERRELLILTDLCRRDHPSPQDYRTFADAFTALGVRVLVLNLGAGAEPNLAVESLSAGTDLWLAGQPTRLYVEVMNYGDTQSEDGHLQLFVDEQLRTEEPCVLPPGSRRQFVFPLTLPGPTHRLEARLRADVLGLDNSLEQQLRVRPNLTVLVVTGDETRREGFEKESVFLQRALAATQHGPAATVVRIVTAAGLVPADLTAADVVLFCGVDRLPAGGDTALDTFLRRGGGVLVATGPNVVPATFNAAFGRWLPAPLAAPYRDTFDAERYITIQTAELPRGLLAEFAAADNGDLGAARVYNYFRLEPRPATGADSAAPPVQRLLTLSNGDALLLETQVGRGRLLLWTSSLGGAWTSLPVHQPYLPLLGRVANYLAGFRPLPLNVARGEPLLAEVAADAGALFVTTPDAQLLACPTLTAGGRTLARFTDTRVSGLYELRDATGKVLARFSVTRDADESDLRPLAGAGLAPFRQALQAIVVATPDELAATLLPPGGGVEKTAWFLLAVVSFLLLDAALTRRWFT